MTSKAKVGSVATETDLRNSDLAINSDHIRLDDLRAKYLAENFGPSTAAVVVELAFGEVQDE
jgi:hypothetical protein